MPDLSPSFVASIARALNSARVPCVLWGQYLLNIHGVPSIIDVSAPSSQKFQTITNTCSVYRFCHSGRPSARQHQDTLQNRDPVSLFAGRTLPIESTATIFTATGLPHSYRRLGSHSEPVSPIRDAVVPTTT